MQKTISIIRITKNMWWSFQNYFSTIFIEDFNLLSCELDIYTFKVLYWVILYQYYIGTKLHCRDLHNVFTVPCQKSKIVSFSSSITKNIIVLTVKIYTEAFRPLSRFPVKLIYCIAFGSASTACCLLKSITIIL